MKWSGKLVGFLLGLMTRRVQLVVLGVVLGHLYDLGVFSGRKPGVPPPPAAPAAGADPYAILGVAATASDDEVEQAYRRAMSEYHPDRVANAAQEIRDLAGTRAREINVAYEQVKRQRGL
jgi:DnaJ-domain-containing protein 1